MSAEKESFESIFRNALEHAEMPVDPAIWQSVAGGIGGAAGGAAGGGISLFAKVAIGIVTAGGISTAAVLLTADEDQPSEPSTSDVAVADEERKDLAPDSIDWKDVVQEEAPGLLVEEESNPETIPVPEIPEVNPKLDGGQTEQESKPVDLNVGEERAENEASPEEDRPGYSMDRGGTPTEEPVPEPVRPDELLKADFTASAVDKAEMQYRFIASYKQAHLYFWKVDDEHIGNLSELVHTFTDEGSHNVSLTVQDESGQEKVHRIVFTVERPSTCIPEIPNVFTPNNDGFNDVLDIEELSVDCAILEFRVYDVLGDLVFAASESVKTWDGYDRYGNRCPVGIYRVEYVLTGIDGKSHPGQQYVNLK